MTHSILLISKYFPEETSNLCSCFIFSDPFDTHIKLQKHLLRTVITADAFYVCMYVCMYVFICSLFNDNFTCFDYTPSNYRIISEE
jgi:hypothetical protein